MPYEIHISTSNGPLADAILGAELPLDAPFRTRRYTGGLGAGYHAIVEFALQKGADVVVGLLAAWLYDLIKKHGTGKRTYIGNREIHPKSEMDVRIVIEQSIEYHRKDDDPGEG